MRYLFIFGLLACSVCSLGAAEYEQRGDLYYKDGQYFTRYKADAGGEYVYSNGCRAWQPYYRWVYTPVANLKTADRWSVLAQAIVEEKKSDAAVKDNAQFIEAAKLLLNRDGPLPAAASATLAYGAAGPTVYGYSYTQTADLYGQTDLSALYQQAARLVENAQGYTERANNGHSALVKEAGEAAAKVAEIREKGRAAVEFMRSLPTPQTKVETKVVVPVVPGVAPAPEAPKDPKLGAAASDKDFLITANRYGCVKCHSGGTVNGGYDVTKHWELSPEKRLAVVGRLLLPKGTPGAMPKEGESLAGEDVLKFIQRKEGVP